MGKGGTPGMMLKGGDATTGVLKTMYEGPYPARYIMKKQGSVSLRTRVIFFSHARWKVRRNLGAKPFS